MWFIIIPHKGTQTRFPGLIPSFRHFTNFFCREFLVPLRELRRDPLSELLLPATSSPESTSPDSCDFLFKVLFLDSDNDRGSFRASRSSETELRA